MNAYVVFWIPGRAAPIIMEDFRKMCSGEDDAPVLYCQFGDPVDENSDNHIFVVKTFCDNPGIVLVGNIFDTEIKYDRDEFPVQYIEAFVDCVVDSDYMPYVSVRELQAEIPEFDWSGKSGNGTLSGEAAGKLELLWNRYLYAHRNEFLAERKHAQLVYTHGEANSALVNYLHNTRGGKCEICGYDYSKLSPGSALRNKQIICYAPDEAKNVQPEDFEKHVHCVCHNCVQASVHNESKYRELLNEPTAILGWQNDIATHSKTYVMFWDSEENLFDKDDFYELFGEVEDPEVNAPMLDWAVDDGEDVIMYDRFFLVRLNGDNPGIVAAGHANQSAWRDTDWNFEDAKVVSWIIECALDSDFVSHISIEQLETEIPDFDWRHGHRGRCLPNEYAQKLELMWSRFLYANRNAIRKADGKAILRYVNVCKIANLNKFFAQIRGCKCEVCGYDYSQLWDAKLGSCTTDDHVVFWPSKDVENLRQEDFDRHVHCVCSNCRLLGQAKLAEILGEVDYAVVEAEDFFWGRTWSEKV